MYVLQGVYITIIKQYLRVDSRHSGRRPEARVQLLNFIKKKNQNILFYGRYFR